METREPFGRLLAAGVAALLAVQVLINTGVTVGLLPVTGLPLPLVSYGGSGAVGPLPGVGAGAQRGLAAGIRGDQRTVSVSVSCRLAGDQNVHGGTLARESPLRGAQASIIRTAPYGNPFIRTSSSDNSPVAPNRPMRMIASRARTGTSIFLASVFQSLLPRQRPE